MPSAGAAGPAPEALEPLARVLLHALVIGAVPRPRAWLHELLRELPPGADRRATPTQDQVRAAMDTLAREGWIVEAEQRRGCWSVVGARWSAAHADLLVQHGSAAAERALCTLEAIERDVRHGQLLAGFHQFDAAVAYVRLRAYAGAGPGEMDRLARGCRWGMDWSAVHERAVLDVLDAASLPRLHPRLQREAVLAELAHLQQRGQARVGLALPEAGLALLAAPAAEGAGAAPGDRPDDEDEDLARAQRRQLRQALAEHLLLQGEAAQALALFEPLAGRDEATRRHVELLQAIAAAMAGDWAAAEAGFDTALAALRKLGAPRKGLLTPLLATPWLQALMAQGGSERLQKALKFCLAEAGKRQPDEQSAWGLMALALQMRLGERPRELALLRPRGRGGWVELLDLWAWLMRAWLTERDDAGQLALQPTADELAAGEALRQRLAGAGLHQPAAQLAAALAVVRQQPPPAGFFVAAPRAGWQVALAALAALGGGGTAEGAEAEGSTVSETRLWWVLDVDDEGRLAALMPFEQKQGARGWGKPREVPLQRLYRAETLPPADAAVARCIRKGAHERDLRFDLAAAVTALMDHPRVAWADAPERALTLVEAGPTLEVLDHGEDLALRLQPPPREEAPRPAWVRTVAEQREIEAWQALTLVRDEPQRVRVIRCNPAQRRAAQLIGLGLTLPRAAAGQLQAVLQGLGAHFEIHADGLQARRELPADSRLRAELAPEGEGLSLRLVVAPLGAAGPRLVPGSGRARLIATVQGETLGVERDLAAERGHLETVLEACPMLAPLPPARAGVVAPAVWLLETAEAALALLERLAPLNAVAALDWPQGKAIRVDGVGLAQLGVQVASGQEWLALQGGVKVDEQLVASLSKVLDWAAGTRSRYLPLGEGRYLALTEELRARIDELAALAEPLPRSQTGGLRVPTVAAGWLAGVLDGAGWEPDAVFQQRLEHLLRARHWQPALPGTLQAELRPYQFEGYQWAMRLADAGLGAVLADDMGLGKTLQAIAVLLARAAGGAALVLAPTSLIGNWAAELRRFAPTLVVQVLAEGEDRAALIEAAGPGTVLLASYQLQWLHSEELAARRWRSLVLDEAQAIKNAATKRSQAVFELGADFRLALSGTPIENRLAELWAVMRVCNPGLLGTLAQFNARFAVPIERDRQPGPRRVLRRLIAPFVLRRTKAQVLDDLPPRTELMLRVQGNETEMAHYEALRRQALREAQEALAGEASGPAQLNILGQLMRLRRAACDPRLVTPELKQPGAKVQAFAALAAELVANGHKALVFSQFVDFLALLREPLEAAGIAHQYLDGSTPAAERSRRVAAFQAGEGDLFLISLKAGGFGLNLTVADYVVIADPWWNPAAEDQASGRAHRIGQQRPVTVYRLVHVGTLEERIVALHERKRELAESVLEVDAAEQGAAAPAPGAAPWKVDELVALMRPERPAGGG